ncbi:MAG: hypothetical protein DHS20C14_11940 [Phycisphaeraceae bacterium]|nr:MAG: hypothetical protein DHS20C14_11940 [Phycisphaeraceae bacterium]
MSTSKPLSRATATRVTWSARAAAGVLAIGAGAIIAFGVPTGGVPADTVQVPPPGPTDLPDLGADPLIPQISHVDFEGIVERISQVDNAPKRPEEPKDPKGPDDPIKTGADPSISDRVAYLGHIRVGDNLLALLRVDEAQRTAGAGRVITGSNANGQAALTVMRVQEHRVLVRGDGEGVWIDRANGGAAAPSTIVIDTPPPAAGRPRVPSADDRIARIREREGDRANGSVLEPDALKRRLDSIERLYEQNRIDEDRYNTMRQRAIEQIERAQDRREQDND